MPWKRVSKKIGKCPPASQIKLKVLLQNVFLESHALLSVPRKEPFLPERSEARKYYAADASVCSKNMTNVET